MQVVHAQQLPASARRSLELRDRELVLFDVPRAVANRLARAGAIHRDGILVLPRNHNGSNDDE